MASLGDSSAVYSSVKDYYGKVLESSKDLKTSACTAGSAPPPIIQDIIKKIPTAVTDKFYGCGNPIPLGIEGKSVLDLGSGSGRDCYAAAALVGPTGSVTGVDMTDEQLTTARENIENYGKVLGYKPNLKFLTGYIEMLQDAGVAKESIDICISNCVINLSPNKRLVLQGVYDSLRDGGELYFSDVYADKQLPEEVRTHDVLLGECLAGALYVKEFEDISLDIGYSKPRVLAISHIEVHDKELKELVKDIKFYSITYRLFKVPSVDKQEVDCGITATYLGTIAGHESGYELDVDNTFKSGVATKVSTNVAEILSSSWLSKYFKVDKSAATDSKTVIKTKSIEALMTDAFSNSSDSCCGGPKKEESSGCCKPKQQSSGCCGGSKKEDPSGCCKKDQNKSGCC